jgi:5-methylthioadenosine/S-adenosylhomocysteine deaminase
VEAPSTLLFKDCSYVVVQRPGGLEVLKGASIYVEGGFVAEVGKVDHSADEVYDCHGLIAAPGLVNAHTHAAMTLLRGYADDLPLRQWLEQKIWPLERKLTYDHCLKGALLACVEMAGAGTSSFMDMYFHPEATIEAAVRTGLRVVACLGMFDFNDPHVGYEQLKRAEEFLQRCRRFEPMGIRPALGPHAPYTCSDELLMGAAELASKAKAPLHIHLAETYEEVEEFKRERGVGEVEYLDRLGVLGPWLVAAHCVWLSDREVELLAERGVKVVHCPVSNLKLGAGVAPIPKMLERGVTVALGTDGACSNNSLNMFTAMKLAALLHKGVCRDPSLVKAEEALKMATVNGAAALGLDNVGLAEGSEADFMLISASHPFMRPIHSTSSVTSHLVYACESVRPRFLVVGGRMIVRDGELTKIDERRVVEEASEAARSLLAG